jgi:hypothetical protein
MLQGLPSTVPRMAFADESFQEDSAEGAYVLAATALEPKPRTTPENLCGACSDRAGRTSFTGTRWIGFNARTPPIVSLTSIAFTLSSLAVRYHAGVRNEHAQCVWRRWSVRYTTLGYNTCSSKVAQPSSTAEMSQQC